MPANEMETEGRELLSFFGKLATPDEYARLLSACAGRRIRMPKVAPDPGGWMAHAIGYESACDLVNRLNREEDYTLAGADVDVPMAGTGIYQQMKDLIERTIIENYRDGKPVSVIAAECGITRRGVQMKLARLRERGVLVEPTREQAVAGRYMVSSAATTQRTIAPVSISARVAECGASSCSTGADAVEAGAAAENGQHEAAPIEVEAGSNRAEAIGALIVRMHGQDTLVRIADLCARRASPAIGFSAAALQREDHPFRQALPEKDAKLLAIAVVAVGLGFDLSRVAVPGEAALRDRPEERPVQVLNRHIREGLMAGHSARALIARLGVTSGQVAGQRRQLRKSGLLPPAASADKHEEA